MKFNGKLNNFEFDFFPLKLKMELIQSLIYN